MPGCAIYGCRSYSRLTKGTNIRYFSFPSNEDIAKQWVQACQRKDQFNIKQARICSKHFHPSVFQKHMKHELLGYLPKTYRNILPDAIPTEFLFKESSSKSTSAPIAKTERTTRWEKYTIKKEKVLQMPEHTFPEETEDKEIQSSSIEPPHLNLKHKKLLDELQQLMIQNGSLKKNLSSVNEELKSFKSMLKRHFGPDHLKKLLNPIPNIG